MSLAVEYTSVFLVGIVVLEAMNTAWTAASEEIYKAQAEGAAQPGADAGAQSNGGASNDTVEDAQFEEVK